MSLHNRVKNRNNPPVSPPAQQPVINQKNVNGWVLQVLGRGIGVMIAPDNSKIAVSHRDGIISIQNHFAVFNHEAAEVMGGMLRKEG
jgi:hypothetical protein